MRSRESTSTCEFFIFKIALIAFFLFQFLAGRAWCDTSFDDSDFADDELDFRQSGDIFDDFTQDIEASQVLEDERFYRYGRFFSAIFGLGTTSFTGNRGIAYRNTPPGYTFGLLYFASFTNAFGLGLAFSEHSMFFGDELNGFQDRPPGLIQVSQLRTYFSYRHYFDTSDLGTAITYSNPYLIGRFEYWYSKNKFIDIPIPDDSGGGIGFAIGGGLEFPLKLREYYANLEFLFHRINFHDRNTNAFRAREGEVPSSSVEDLTGNVMSVFLNFVISW